MNMHLDFLYSDIQNNVNLCLHEDRNSFWKFCGSHFTKTMAASAEIFSRDVLPSLSLHQVSCMYVIMTSFN